MHELRSSVRSVVTEKMLASVPPEWLLRNHYCDWQQQFKIEYWYRMIRSSLRILLTVLLGSVIFVGIPLLAWGPSRAALFLQHPARIAYIGVIVLLQLFPAFCGAQPGKRKQKKKEGVASHKLDLLLIQFLSLAIIISAPYCDSHYPIVLPISDMIRYCGLALVTFGFILMQISEKYLDRQFSVEVTVQENHQLITDGPYRLIRHPRYLGILIFFSGIAFVFNSFVSLLIVCCLAAVIAWRIGAEESLMKMEFGDEWDRYCSRSCRLIPYVF